MKILVAVLTSIFIVNSSYAELKSLDDFFSSITKDENKLLELTSSLEKIKNEVETYLIDETTICYKGREVEVTNSDGSVTTKRNALSRNDQRKCLNDLKTFQLSYIDKLYGYYKKIIKLKHKEEISLLESKKNDSVKKLQDLINQSI